MSVNDDPQPRMLDTEDTNLLSKLEPFQIIGEIKNLEAQLAINSSPDLENQMQKKKKQLTDEVVNILDIAQAFSPSEKIQLVSELIPLVSWDYNRFLENDAIRDLEEKRIAIKEKPLALRRHSTLKKFLDDIPNTAFSEESLNGLLEAVNKASSIENLAEVRERVILVIQDMPPEEGIKWLPRLKKGVHRKIWPHGEDTVEYLDAIRKWKPEDTMPVIDSLFTHFRDREVERYSGMKNLASFVENFPTEYQRKIIFKALSTSGLKGNSGLFYLIKKLPQEEARTFLGEVMKLPVEKLVYKSLSLIELDDLHNLASVMSNWPIEEIDKFLENSDNTGWINWVINQRCHRKTEREIEDMRKNY